MRILPKRHALLLAVTGATLALGLAACGGDDSDSEPEAAAEQATTQNEASATGAPALAAVLACLTDAGVAAEEQTSNTSGETIGIDYPDGRTVISFEKSEEDAELTESVQPDPSADVYREGLIVVSAPGSPDAGADRPAIETCIKG